MPRLLPVAIDDLLHARTVESSRIELKASWDERTTGLQVLHTVCGFANDIHNLNGGYVIIGVEAPDGVAIFPPKGLTAEGIDQAQRWLRGRFRLMDPEFQPVLSPEVVQGKHLLVVWAPGSETRPHAAPETFEKGARRQYFVRLGSETVAATGAVLRELLDQTARVPFDERRHIGAATTDLRATLVREFLAEIGSDLTAEPSDVEVYRRCRLIARQNGHEVPRNVALLFFADDPEVWFPGARIEVVELDDPDGGDVLRESRFRGPVPRQIKDALLHLEGRIPVDVAKRDDVPEALRRARYPLSAVREAIVNAVYHRGYDGVPEPTKVYLYPDRLEITSYPGPVAGLTLAHFAAEARRPAVPARNKRIGELLKELRLAEGRGTGIGKLFRVMAQNGAPPPTFDFDAERTYFTVTLRPPAP